MNEYPFNDQATRGALYSIPTVCKILHINPRHVRRWVQGYVFNSGEHTISRVSDPLLVTPVYESNNKTLITFEQMIEVMFIDIFEKRKIKLPIIRAAAKRLAVELNVKHPLAMPKVLTDNIRIYHKKIVQDVEPEGIEEKSVLADLALMGQMVMEPLIQQKIEQIDYEDKIDPDQFWPLGRNKLVLMDRDQSFGQPIDPVSGITTRTLNGMIKSGEDVESVARWFKVKKQAVLDAIDFEEQLSYRLKLAA